MGLRWTISPALRGLADIWKDRRDGNIGLNEVERVCDGSPCEERAQPKSD